MKGSASDQTPTPRLEKSESEKAFGDALLNGLVAKLKATLTQKTEEQPTTDESFKIWGFSEDGPDCIEQAEEILERKVFVHRYGTEIRITMPVDDAHVICRELTPNEATRLAIGLLAQVHIPHCFELEVIEDV